MNFFEQELRKIVEPICPDATYVGRFCFVPLGENNRAKISFATTRISNHYDTLQMKIINKGDGEIDTSRVSLLDVFGEIDSGNPSAKYPHIWEDGRECSWYGFRPTQEHYAALTKTVGDYVELFQEQTVEQGMTMQQGMTM